MDESSNDISFESINKRLEEIRDVLMVLALKDSGVRKAELNTILAKRIGDIYFPK